MSVLEKIKQKMLNSKLYDIYLKLTVIANNVHLQYTIAFLSMITVIVYFILFSLDFFDNIDDTLSTILSFSMFFLGVYLLDKYKLIMLEKIEHKATISKYAFIYQKLKMINANKYVQYSIAYVSITIFTCYCILFFLGFFDFIDDTLSIIIFFSMFIFINLYHKYKPKKD